MRAVFQALGITTYNYKTLVLLRCLLYNSETWTVKHSPEQRLTVCEMACLRRILGVTRRDRLHNDDIKKHLHLQKEVNYRIRQRCLRYFSHVMRMNDADSRR